MYARDAIRMKTRFDWEIYSRLLICRPKKAGRILLPIDEHVRRIKAKESVISWLL